MIEHYKFYQHFDINFLMLSLADANQLAVAKLLIEHDEDLKITLIKRMATDVNCKKGAKLIKAFKYNPDDFPEIQVRMMKKSVRYYIGRYLYKPKNPNESKLSLDKVVDLFSGFP